jgi:hypothetical protein
MINVKNIIGKFGPPGRNEPKSGQSKENSGFLK